MRSGAMLRLAWTPDRDATRRQRRIGPTAEGGISARGPRLVEQVEAHVLLLLLRLRLGRLRRSAATAAASIAGGGSRGSDGRRACGFGRARLSTGGPGHGPSEARASEGDGAVVRRARRGRGAWGRAAPAEPMLASISPMSLPCTSFANRVGQYGSTSTPAAFTSAEMLSAARAGGRRQLRWWAERKGGERARATRLEGGWAHVAHLGAARGGENRASGRRAPETSRPSSCRTIAAYTHASSAARERRRG